MELEEGLLYKLANAKGDILDDIELIENLEYSKKLSVEIEIKVTKAKITEAKINETSENYRPAANRGALFYFLLSDLMKIHSFYKYSLDSFVIVIHRAIDAISENKMFTGVDMIPFTGKEEDLAVENAKEAEAEEAEEEAEEAPVEETKAEEKPEPAEGEEKAEGEEGADGEPKEEGVEGEKKPEEEGKKDEEEGLAEDPMSPRTLKKRVEELIASLTYTGF